MGKNITIYLILFVLISSCKDNNVMIDKTVVKEFNIKKYLGTWYEIARYDHKFERGLMGVTASYSLRNDGKIKVVNSGYKEILEGKRKEAIGKAKIPDPDQPSKLKVSFFWFFYGDYFILELDEDYQWTVIGSSSDKYLWILSRIPQMDESLYNMILERLKNRGYNTNKLIKIEQKK